jgi:hypothetical protein
MTTNQISKEQRRDHQGASATGRRMIATAQRESINPHEFFPTSSMPIISQKIEIWQIAYRTQIRFGISDIAPS